MLVVFSLDKITLPEKSDKGVSWGASTPGRAKDVEHKIPDVDETEMGPELGPLARYQLMNGLRKFEIVYEGDPDLQPIRSHEITWLVRALYHITNYFNTRVSMFSLCRHASLFYQCHQ